MAHGASLGRVDAANAPQAYLNVHGSPGPLLPRGHKSFVVQCCHSNIFPSLTAFAGDLKIVTRDRSRQYSASEPGPKKEAERRRSSAAHSFRGQTPYDT